MHGVLLSLLLLTGTSPAIDHPYTYLLSVGGIRLTDGQSIKAFALKTWGVAFTSICRIPAGWTIKAGGSATPDGELTGEGSLGATWFLKSNPEELRNLALVTLYDPVQKIDVGSVPATFQGHVTISTDPGDRKHRLDYRNITLVPARRCPER
jgi:hypothetical protein